MSGPYTSDILGTCAPIDAAMRVTLLPETMPTIGKCAAPTTHSSICTMFPAHSVDYSPKAGEEDDDEWWQDIAKQLLDDDFVGDDPVRNLEGHAGHSGPIVELHWIKMVEVNPHGKMIHQFVMDDVLVHDDTFVLPYAAADLVDTLPLKDQMDHFAAAMILKVGGVTAGGHEWINTVGVKHAIATGPVSVTIEADQSVFQVGALMGDFLHVDAVGPIAAGGAHCPEPAPPTTDYIGMVMTWFLGLIGGMDGYGQ